MITSLNKQVIAIVFDKFGRIIADNGEHLTVTRFSKSFTNIKRSLLSFDSNDYFCYEADRLAIDLVKRKKNDFAGIIYSSLCKINEYIPRNLEKFAKKGYEVARENGDYVHMMARLNDLRKIYMNKPDKLYDYIQILYKQEKCLKQLTRHYEDSVASYRSIIRKPATKSEYLQMLAYVQTEIGKLTRRKHPNDAKRKLLSAREYFVQSNNEQSVKYIDLLIDKIEKQLSEQKKIV